MWGLECSEGCINTKFNPVWPILDHYIPKKKLWFLIFQTSIQVLKWSVPDGHPDSWVLSILKFSGIFKNCMRGIFYSLEDTLLFKCSDFWILWSFWSSPHQMHIQMIEWSIILEYSGIVLRQFTHSAEIKWVIPFCHSVLHA